MPCPSRRHLTGGAFVGARALDLHLWVPAEVLASEGLVKDAEEQEGGKIEPLLEVQGLVRAGGTACSGPGR